VHLRLRPNSNHTGGAESGVSLLEMVVVLGVVGVLLAITGGALMSFARASQADGAMETVLNSLRLARDRSIGERRNFHVRFIEPNHIQIARVEIPSNEVVVVSDVYLEGNLEFLETDGAGDTPDDFGADSAIAFGTSPTRMFTSEGTFVDTSGDPLNGTLFLSAKGQPLTARAITILGATALVHAWRWNGSDWVD
jgi:prepilin-type N-terminal cleavage/methylation domain-containing protein